MEREDGTLFRQTAMEHYLKGEEGGAVLRVSPPWTWALFWTLGALVLLALLGSVACPVEVTSRGRGVLRPVPGVRLLNAQVGGMVSQVLVRSGEAVQAGQPLVRLDAAAVQAQLLEVDRQLETLRTESRFHAARMDALFAEQERTLRSRKAMLAEQVQSQQASVALYDRKVKANERLAKEGIQSDLAVDDAREALAQAQRALGSSRQALAGAGQELAALEARRQEEVFKRDQDLRGAQTKRDALQFSLAQTQITAPTDGVLEAVLVKPGDVLQAGQAIGKIVPQQAPYRVVAFVPEKDRAFLKAGELARLELDQYPYAEFGTVKARILRISDDLATAADLQEAFAETAKPEGATYRVELEPLQLAPTARMPRLGSGMLLQVRFTLRRQRPVTLLLEPLRRWLD